jgi:nucleotide-binding universal stress UspA family protein
MNDHPARRTIVVGVNGSSSSLSALRWAGEQAPALRADIVAVHAWEPIAPRLAPYASTQDRPAPEQERDLARNVLESAVRSSGVSQSTHVRTVLVEGAPVPVLLHESHGALLLALGHRSLGGAGMPGLGPVGRDCLRSADVPVVAVPSDPAQTSRERQDMAPVGAVFGSP